MLDLRLRSSLKTENSLTHPPQPSTDSDIFETVNTNSSTEVETVEIEEVIIEENQQDPLAQTFFVGETNGIYVNSVDVFFFQTDETATVTFQIREVELGTPTQKVLAYSETIISDDIVTSEDGPDSTQFN